MQKIILYSTLACHLCEIAEEIISNRISGTGFLLTKVDIADDLELLKKVTSKLNIPVIASGGVGTLEHFAEGILEGGANSVLAASVFHFGQLKIKDVKRYLADKNIPVRI